MSVIANLINGIFDLLVVPFGAAASWAMLVLSILTGLAMLLLFKAATNQNRLVVARRVLTGHLYEMGLYQDHLSVLLKIQGALLLANLRYLRQSLPALLVILLPMILILTQLDSRFASRPYQPGESTLVTAQLSGEQTDLLDQLTLRVPDGVVLESTPVRDRQQLTVTWRVRVEKSGDYELTITAADGRTWTKQLVAEGNLPQMAATREQAGWHYLLLNPGEAPLPGDSPITTISLQLPERHTSYLGLELHWLLAFCLFSLLFGFAVKDVFKVKF